MTYAERRLLEEAGRSGMAFRPLQWRYNEGTGFTDLSAKPCPFVTPENRCNVYDIRPYNCRRFGCMRPDVKTEPFAASTLTKRLIESSSARSQYQVMQAEAQEWAVAHGWKDETDARIP